jgi:hypothetical protein
MNFISVQFVNIVILLLMSLVFSPCFANPAADRAAEICGTELWPNELLSRGSLPFVMSKDDVACIAGEITKKSAESAINVINKGLIKFVVLISSGGDASAAIDLANKIYSKKITTIVYGYCISSCANYLFLAGDSKYVLDNSVVAWHGAPLLDGESNPALRKVAEEHIAFFRMLDVEDTFTKYPPCDAHGNPRFSEALAAGRRPAWVYSKNDLEQKFHVRGIAEMWEFTSQSDIDEAFSSKTNPLIDIYLFENCNQ